MVFMDCANLYGTASHRPENPDARFKNEILSTNQYRQMTGFRYADQEQHTIQPHFLARWYPSYCTSPCYAQFFRPAQLRERRGELID